MAVYENSTALRHRPKQVRGQRKVEHIVRCAEALFAEVGFENATTNAIATRANVSIGSLYQFFSSKESILQAMASRYLTQTRIAMSAVLMEAQEGRHLDDLLTELLNTLIKLQEQRPYFLQCLGYSQPSPALSGPVAELGAEMVAQVDQLLKRGTNEVDPQVRWVRARVFVRAISTLLPIVVNARGKERARAIAEVKAILSRYLEPTLKTQGML